MNRIAAGLDRILAKLNLRSFQRRRFQKRERYRADYDRVAAALLATVEFETMLDVGCANGFLLHHFHEAGKAVQGIDLSPHVKSVLPPTLLPVVKIGDFSEASGRFDLVCCVEVAEHLPAARSIELVEKLIGLTEGAIYFSAAPPGQLGYGHINCRPHTEWLDWFAQRGWTPDEARTNTLRTRLGRLEKATWLGRNSFLLVPVRQLVANGAQATHPDRTSGRKKLTPPVSR
jgi:SAM-dependent methyltransferase